MSRRQHTVYQIPVRLARGELKNFSFSARRRVWRVGNVWDDGACGLPSYPLPCAARAESKRGGGFPPSPALCIVALGLW